MPLRVKVIRPWEEAPTERKPHQRLNPNAAFYNSRAWRKASKLYLMQHPFCECPKCAASDKPLTAQMVDHITPINQGGASLDPRNFQAMAHKCHNRKSGAGG